MRPIEAALLDRPQGIRDANRQQRQPDQRNAVEPAVALHAASLVEQADMDLTRRLLPGMSGRAGRASGTTRPALSLEVQRPESHMSRMISLVVAVLVSPLLAEQAFTEKALAQLTPPAGSAGAGMAPINGVPYGPANPRALSDPSGLGNASNLPPLRSNIPATPAAPAPPAPARAAAPTNYPYASQRVFSAREVERKSKTSPHRRGRREVSSFTGICRGC